MEAVRVGGWGRTLHPAHRDAMNGGTCHAGGWRTTEMQIPPLRFAPVRMTKCRLSVKVRMCPKSGQAAGVARVDFEAEAGEFAFLHVVVVEEPDADGQGNQAGGGRGEHVALLDDHGEQ